MISPLSLGAEDSENHSPVAEAFSHPHSNTLYLRSTQKKISVHCKWRCTIF
jgi:hypothetical protein